MPGITNLLAEEAELDEVLRESGLMAHARRELEISGFGEDYDGMIGRCVMELIATLAKQGHSGGSAQKTLRIFNLLAERRSLTSISSKPEEWSDISEMWGSPMWQNIRDSRYFSTDGGKTYYNGVD